MTRSTTTPDTACRDRLPQSIKDLVAAIEAEESFTPAMAKRLLEASSVTPEDLAAWADYEHPSTDSYGRNLVYDGGCFELMAMSWVDGDMAAIHDHGYTQWGAVKLYGDAEHAIFKMRDGRLTTVERRRFQAGDVVSVAHDLIHQMGNVGSEPFLSLHLYGCYGRDGDITADARLYELDEGNIQRTSGGVFFALPDAQVNDREPNLAADFPTELRHKVELLKRLVTAEGSLENGELRDPRAKALVQELCSAETWEKAENDVRRSQDLDPHLRSVYVDIFHQEVAATARLLAQLQEKGLLDHPVAEGLLGVVGEIDEVGADPRTTAETWADLVQEHVGVELELPVAA